MTKSYDEMHDTRSHDRLVIKHQKEMLGEYIKKHGMKRVIRHDYGYGEWGIGIESPAAFWCAVRCRLDNIPELTEFLQSKCSHVVCRGGGDEPAVCDCCDKELSDEEDALRGVVLK